MNIPKTLKSERLTLRPWSFKDVGRCNHYANDARYSEFLTYKLPHTLEETEAFIAGQILADQNLNRIYVIELGGESIGSIRITFKSEHTIAELGYGIWKPWWGKGIATESVNLLLDASFQNVPQLERVFAFAEPENSASIRVMEKAGFQHEGTSRKAFLRNGELRDKTNLAILREEWHSLERPRYWNLSEEFEIETPRLIIRKRTKEFSQVAFEASRYEGFTDGMLWNPPETVEELYPNHDSALEAWRTGKAYMFAIHSKEGHIVGSIGIRPDDRDPDNHRKKNLGFWTHPEHQGKGYMTEAVKGILSFGFHQYGADSITADIADWNIASKRVLEKSGMTWMATYPDDYEKNGKLQTSEYYQITKEEFESI